MNGIISKAIAAVSLTAGMFAMAGCTTGPSFQDRYARFVDLCWPERYAAMARGSVNEAFAAQVANGHALDQTMWNYHFEAGTDKLTPGGQFNLDRLARRRPAPDPHVFLQTANDIAYDPEAPEKFIQARVSLNSKRTAAIYTYLRAQTAERPAPWKVTVHDPSEVGIPAAGMLLSISQRDTSFQGVLPTTGGGGLGAGSGTSSAGQ